MAAVVTRWAELIMEARELERQAQAKRNHAMATRCHAEESGWARCTADEHPSHEHRYDAKDFPL